MFSQFSAGLRAFEAPLDARVAFIRRTYLHVAGAVGLFVAVSWFLYTAGVGEGIARWASGGQWRWLAVLGGFALLGWLGQAMAHGARSTGAQYGGLGIYTVGEALIFSPLLFIAQSYYPGVLAPAVVITLIVFAGLSAVVLITKKDFSFLRMFMVVGGFAALGVILCGAIFGFTLGIWFTGAMLLFASGAILYSTSRVLHEYRVDQHVGAALELFAAVALLFWYVLQLLMQLQRRD